MNVGCFRCSIRLHTFLNMQGIYVGEGKRRSTLLVETRKHARQIVACDPWYGPALNRSIK